MSLMSLAVLRSADSQGKYTYNGSIVLFYYSTRTVMMTNDSLCHLLEHGIIYLLMCLGRGLAFFLLSTVCLSSHLTSLVQLSAYTCTFKNDDGSVHLLSGLVPGCYLS